jgi:hypothetical protein
VLQDERTLVDAKRGALRLGFALLLKFYTRYGRYLDPGFEDFRFGQVCGSTFRILGVGSGCAPGRMVKWLVMLSMFKDDQRRRWSEQTVVQRLLGAAGILVILLVGVTAALGNWSSAVAVPTLVIVVTVVAVTVPRASKSLRRRNNS